MPLSVGMSLLIILAVALTTFATRVVPFLIFPPVLSAPYGIPEAAAVLVTAALHVWKRNNLLSIGAGTVLYMFLVQAVF